MKRLLLPLSILVVVGLLWGNVTPAAACSVDHDYDPIADSDLVVSGRFSGWQLIEDATRLDPKKALDASYHLQVLNDPKYYGPLDPIRVRMTIDRVYKGTAPEIIEIVDGGSLFGNAWIGSSGACGTFDSDPTGMYAVLGLVRADDGTYRAGLFRLFYIGTEAPEAYDGRWLSQVAPLMPGTLPGGGGPPARAELPVWKIVALGVLGPLAFLAGAAFLRRRGG